MRRDRPRSRGAAARAIRPLVGWRGTVAVCLLLMASAACRPPAEGTRTTASGTQIAIHVLDDPPRIGPATVEVLLSSGAGPVGEARVTVTGDMTHAGMVPVIDRAEDLGGGRYRTRTFGFTMAGDWVLTVDVVLVDGGRRQGTLEVAVRP